MIRFSCKCGFEFNVTEDRAGQMLQCPRCALLVDVPRKDQLGWLGPDGTYAVAEPDLAPPVPGATLAEMYRAYSRNRTDPYGNDKDLRPDEEHFRRIGNDPASPDGHAPQRVAPRYDPVTGERIVPLALKDEVPQPVIPVLEPADDDEPLPVVEAEPIIVAAPVLPVQSLTYATGTTGRPTTLRSLTLDLLIRPANITVLFFVYWFYVAAILAKIVLNAFALAVLHVPTAGVAWLNLPLWLLAAHYGCVVEEVGPEAVDELPRPLRNLSLWDDVFGPALKVGLAGAICYGPMVILAAAAGLDRPPVAAATAALAGLGTVLFPAVVLTLLTGSTVLNLTPGRVVGVMAACGPQYLASAVLCGLTVALSALLVLGPSVFPVLGVSKATRIGDHMPVLVPGLFLTMYVTHLFAWHLGLMYRAHHDSFPWVGQRHIPTPRPDRPLPVVMVEP